MKKIIISISMVLGCNSLSALFGGKEWDSVKALSAGFAAGVVTPLLNDQRQPKLHMKVFLASYAVQYGIIAEPRAEHLLYSGVGMEIGYLLCRTVTRACNISNLQLDNPAFTVWDAACIVPTAYFTYAYIRATMKNTYARNGN